MNLVIFVVGTVLAVVAARPLAPPIARRAATAALIVLLVAAPLLTSSTSILLDALTAMCIAYGWNIIGGFTGYAAFGNVAYLGLGAFVAAGFMSRQPGHLGGMGTDPAQDTAAGTCRERLRHRIGPAVHSPSLQYIS